MRKLTGTLTALALASAISTAPVVAQEDCYDSVIASCAEAMDGAAWYERFALGVICSGMLAGCAGGSILPN